MRRTCALLATALTAAALTAAAPSDAAKAPVVQKFKNCAQLNQKYAHGVGKSGARDKVSNPRLAVKNFTVNTNVYNANKGLDRDKDGIACEKR